MSIDHEGTRPGLLPGAQVKPKTLSMKCRNPKCDSIEASEIQLTNLPVSEYGVPSQRVYRCVKCGDTRGLGVGGHFTY